MPSLAKIRRDQEFLEAFHSFTSTYQQLAAMKMQKIRDSIIQTRRYIDGLGDVYVDIEQSHQKTLSELVTEEKSGHSTRITFSAIKKNGRQAAVFISPDTKFSGKIVHQVFNNFRRHLESNPQIDVIVIGQVGTQMMQAALPNRKFDSYQIPQSLNKFEDLKEIINVMVKYDLVDVFYARFYSLISQGTVTTNITGNLDLKQKDQADRGKRDFLFEPPLKTILQFFEIQIFSSLVQQTVNESYLATLGSRITTLESATQSAKDQKKKINAYRRRQIKERNNKKQTNQIAGLSLW